MSYRIDTAYCWYDNGSMIVKMYFINQLPFTFDELPDGSWFGSMKVDNDDIWNNYIKTGEFQGFSVEGVFEPVLADEKDEDIIQGIINNING